MYSRRPDPPLTFDFLAVNTGRFLLTGFCFFHASVRTSASRRGTLSTAARCAVHNARCYALEFGTIIPFIIGKPSKKSRQSRADASNHLLYLTSYPALQYRAIAART